MFGLDRTEDQAQLERITANPYIPERDSAPGFFGNAGSATLAGVGASAVGANALLNAGLEPVVDLFARPIDAVFGSDLEGGFERTFVTKAKDIQHSFRPDPQVTGFLGQLSFGLGSVLPQAVAGGVVGGPAGAAALVGASQGNTAKDVALAEGVDPMTATGVGALEGATQAIGVMAPVGVGVSLWQKIISGAGINVGIGAAQRGATGELLRQNGYEAMAEQYRVLDAAALATDAILGGAFGVLAKGEAASRSPLPSEIDAALAAIDNRNFEIDTAPGIPADIATRNAHTDAMETAMRQAMAGEPVDVAATLAKAESFVPRPVDPARTVEIAAVLEETNLARTVAENDSLPAAKVVEGDPVILDPAQGIAKAPDLTILEKSTETEFKSAAITADDLNLIAAKNITDATPDMPVARGVMDDQVQISTAKAALDEADAAIKQAKDDGKLFDVAINCFLGRGQ